MTAPVYVIPSSPSWHTTATCKAIDTARLHSRTDATQTTDPGDRPACLVCAATGLTEWTLTTQNLWELFELIEPAKPYVEWPEDAEKPVITGLIIREHKGQDRRLVRFGWTIRHKAGLYTVHPTGEETPL